MAHIERKVRFLGIWHENVITDTTMRQIIARAHAEKGQKARLRLSPKGLNISRTVVFQEQSLTAFPLHNIYFLTLNHRHPTCLLCIVADPNRKYGIVAVKAATVLDAQQIIDTFNRLKNDPTLQTGNVVLRRKDDGNWTLRDHSVHNVNRHLMDVFQESPPGTPITGTLSNGEVTEYHLQDGGGKNSQPTNPHILNHEGELLVARTSSGGFGFGGSQNGDLADIRSEVEHLSRELQDIRVMVERGGSRRESTSSKHLGDGSHYASVEVRATGGDSLRNGRIPTDDWVESRPGEARVVVTDHRKGATTTTGVVHAHGGGNLALANGRVYRQITVPEALPHGGDDPVSPNDNSIISGHQSHYEDVDQTFASLPSAYSVRRRVSPQRLLVPQDKERKWSASSSIASSRMGSGHVTFDPAAYQHGRQSKSRTLRYRAGLSVPSTVVKPIEETYRLPKHATWRRQQHVYVVPDAQGHLVVTPAAGVVPVRRQRPVSVHVMQGNGLRDFDEREEVDDAFL